MANPQHFAFVLVEEFTHIALARSVILARQMAGLPSATKRECLAFGGGTAWEDGQVDATCSKRSRFFVICSTVWNRT